MIGWKRIVITVADKIGKQHMTYGQGAAAQIRSYRRLMVHIRASVVTSDDPIFSLRKIDNALGLITLGGEMLAVLADVPWLIVEFAHSQLLRQREAERSPAFAHTYGRPVSIRPQARQVIRRWPLGT